MSSADHDHATPPATPSAANSTVAQALQELEQRYQQLVGALPELVALHTAEQLIFINHAGAALLGAAGPEELIGTSALDWVHPEFRELLLERITTQLPQTSGGAHFREKLVRPDGSVVEVEMTLIPTVYQGQTAMQIICRDITSRLAAEEALLRQPLYDHLTGLPNRALFLDRLHQATERAHFHQDSSFALMLIDVDRFKQVNDTLSHRSGDQLLVEIAMRIQRCLRPDDTLARMSGDEFAVLLDPLNERRDAQMVARRIQRTVEQPVLLDSGEVFSSVSIGLAINNLTYDRAEDLLRDADTALYRAKLMGRRRCEIFTPTMRQQAVEQMQLERDLRRALERSEFQLHYQPIVSLRTGTLVGFEALLRWLHPQRGMIHPDEMIAVAEETGLIVPIGRWVLLQACKQLQQWRALTTTPIAMSINLSSAQISRPEIVDEVEEALRMAELPPQLLRLELTESMLIKNEGNIIETLKALREMDVQLYLDDFGTGYSSLSYLHQFPINALKIERSFVERLRGGTSQLDVIQAIMTLARSFKLDVIAEGIEVREQLIYLQAMQCDYGQGYYFSRPLPADAAADMLLRGPRW